MNILELQITLKLLHLLIVYAIFFNVGIGFICAVASEHENDKNEENERKKDAFFAFIASSIMQLKNLLNRDTLIIN